MNTEPLLNANELASELGRSPAYISAARKAGLPRREMTLSEARAWIAANRFTSTRYFRRAPKEIKSRESCSPVAESHSIRDMVAALATPHDFEISETEAFARSVEAMERALQARRIGERCIARAQGVIAEAEASTDPERRHALQVRLNTLIRRCQAVHAVGRRHVEAHRRYTAQAVQIATANELVAMGHPELARHAFR